MRPVLLVVLVIIVCAGRVQGAKLTPLASDPQGYFNGGGSGQLTASGPRYDGYGNELPNSAYDFGEYTDSTVYSGDGNDLFVSAAAVVDDATHYPHLANIALTDGSISAGIILETIVPDDGIGGGGGETSPGNSFTNSVRMAMSSTLRLRAHPVTWENNTSYPHGQEDNETFSTNASFHAATNGFVYFRIDPVFNEQNGDPIQVKLDHFRDYNAYMNFGNSGYGGSMQVSNAFTLNNDPLSSSGGTVSANIGDVIGIQLDMNLHFEGGSQVAQPDSHLYRYMVVAGVDGFANATIDIPLTPGCSQQAPLLPDQITSDTGTYIFADLTIGDEGVGIDTPAWIDPDVAVGYDLTVTGAGVTGLVLPDLLWAVGPCQIWYDDGSGPVALTYYDEWDEVYYSDFSPGDEIYFPQAVQVFGITGIDPLLELDPANPNAFPLGLIFDGPSTGVSVNMTPLAVPEPTTVALLVMSGLALIRRRGTA